MKAFTSAQQQAIRERGNVLVVASAGTGKTSTLVHRCVSLLLEENCSLDEILMVTFTEAAAAQMRSRIRAELLRVLESFPADSLQVEQVQKQLALLETAHICTLHSFCLELVRTHFYQLGIDPAILVLDERQTAPLMSQTLDALFRRYYSTDTLEAASVQELVRDWGGGLDERIRQRVVKLHRYTQALDDPEGWLAKQEAIYQQEEPVAWRQWFEAGFDQWRAAWLPELAPYARVPAVARFIELLGTVPKPPRFEQAQAALRSLHEADQDAQNWPRGTKTETREALKHFFTELDFLASNSGAGFQPGQQVTDPLHEDWHWVRPHLSTLLRLTREFTAAFSIAKREAGGVDFSDLEQFALRLLRDPAVARQWQQRLRFIFVDECQDINRAQDAILTALSREGTQPNRFLVGDVKQSIYRFRLANPRIFCHYEELWRRTGHGGTRIPLADNFRSREALLHFVNRLFSALMQPEVGGVAYDADVHLRFGGAEERKQLSVAGAQNPQPRVELHLIDLADTEGEPVETGDEQAQASLLDLMNVEREARLVALRLRDLREQRHLIWDEAGGRFRPVEWRDLVVLMRSPAGKVEAFAKEFNRLGIPLAGARSGFFQSMEILDLLSLLKLIDNPLQDEPLLAVLRSPLAGFSLDDLAEVRAHNREKPFWMALGRFERDRNSSDSPGRSKAALFLGQFRRWRDLARQSSLSHCLETVLAETHYEALLLAEPRGEERVANVGRLLQLAREYDPYQRQGLYRFLRFVEAQEEAEVEMEPASAQTENAVRLMSIHKSKGLEFPVVVLANLGGQFNLQDLRQDILLHETYGLCSKVKPPGADQSYPSIAYWLARRDEQRELLGEEMRLLYVALTRARDTLILTGSGKGPRWSSLEAQGEPPPPTFDAHRGHELERRSPTRRVSGLEDRTGSETGAPVHGKGDGGERSEAGARQLSERGILSARSYLDWLLRWLPQVTASTDWSSERAGQTALLRWRIYAANDPQLLVTTGAEAPSADRPAPGAELHELDLLKLKERLLWNYPFAAATLEPAVKRVSTLIWEQAEPVEDAQLLFNYGPGATSRMQVNTGKRPANKLAAVDIGSAHHRFLEVVDLGQVSRLEDLKQQAAQMLEDGTLTQEEAGALNLKALLAFWNSEIGRKILSQAPSVNREIPFTARVSPADFADMNLCPNAADLQDEYFVVRGKADLAVLLPKEIWLLDFKTDQLTELESEEKARLYAPQLKLYALALSRIYARPVVHRWLHFLALAKTVSI